MASAAIPDGIVAGVNNGLFHAKLQEPFTCPSGNCLWLVAIKTLGADGHCDDVTTELQAECFSRSDVDIRGYAFNTTTCTYQFPSGTIKEAIGLYYEGPDAVQGGTTWNSSATLGAAVSATSLFAAEYSSNTSGYTTPNDGVLLNFEVLRLHLPFRITEAFGLPAAQGRLSKRASEQRNSELYVHKTEAMVYSKVW